ncbi:MAG: hypothetical protein K9M98_03165 [Cephaloticoccus sp.]|nr:hypothetical protein [Cephaloticoccus sp.]MCF7759482.1 hypothetical protein [Cephaloticoccus sp.]
MSDEKFSLVFKSLSDDCSQVQPQHQGTQDGLDAAKVRTCLDAFAAIPAVDLVGVDAKIRLRCNQQHVAVSRSGDALYFTLMPENSHAPEKSTPDGIMAYLTGADPIQLEPEPESLPTPVRRKRKLSLGLSLGSQIAVLAITLTILAGMFHKTITVSPPHGYVLIEDSSRINMLQQQFDGTYGSPKARMSIQISHGRVSFFAVSRDGAPPQFLKEESFRYALRGGHTVALLGAKGDILEFNPDGSLLFGAQSYPRTGT